MNHNWLMQQGLSSMEHQWYFIRYPGGAKGSLAYR